ncbi:uncharacterized protein LOC131322486 [Rhododendron vialii]|uniref:uncharacterized protein LOC131322486 n=1 Tax=Rhododendron vialii TaxID=182163 RepID=UPI00265FBD77|nr:uncharacterized protein LOC131322486 [Rhododendron vialii]
MGLTWFLNSAHTLVSGHSTHDVRNQTQEAALSFEITTKGVVPEGFQMPLHYPRYKREDYEKMEELKIDLLLREYGIGFKGSLEEKRNFAIGAFLWPDQLS